MGPHKLMLFCLKFAGMINIGGGPLLKVYTFYHFSIMIIFGTSLLLFIILEPKPPLEKLQTVHYIVALAQIFCKFLSIVLNQEETLEILDTIEKLSEEAKKDPENIAFITRADRLTKKISKFFLYFFIGYYPLRVTSLLLKYLVFHQPPQLFLEGTWIPQAIKSRYVLSVFYQVFTSLCAGFTNASYSCFIVFLTVQISAQMQILGRMFEESNSLKPCIILHQKLMRLFFRVNKLLASLMFVELILTSLYSCICTFLIITSLSTGGREAANHAHVLTLVLIRSFLICYCGNIIIKQGEKLHFSAYFSNWAEKDQKEMKCLQTVMILTTVNPFKYNYRNFMTMDMPRFMKSMQTTYSYLTMLLSLADHN